MSKITQSKKWWRLLRPHTLTAAIMPVLIGTATAWVNFRINWPLFTAMLIASVLIQSAVNMFNEYFDYKRGLDTADSVGIGGVIVRNEISEQVVLHIAQMSFAVSVLLGVYICMKTSWWVAAIGSVAMAVGYFYSAGKSPIAYTPFGEIAAGVFMGFIIVLISFFIQAGTITSNSILLSIPISILVAAILLANNIRDLDGDKKKGRRTLAVILGKHRATSVLSAMFICNFTIVILLVLFRVAPFSILISLLSLPRAFRAIKTFRTTHTPMEMMSAMKDTSVLHTQFGILFAIGIMLTKFQLFR
jgi:1,4-dihydroxy-2-naphthoate octaprenyltransferase